MSALNVRHSSKLSRASPQSTSQKANRKFHRIAQKKWNFAPCNRLQKQHVQVCVEEAIRLEKWKASKCDFKLATIQFIFRRTDSRPETGAVRLIEKYSAAKFGSVQSRKESFTQKRLTRHTRHGWWCKYLLLLHVARGAMNLSNELTETCPSRIGNFSLTG